MKLPRFTSGNIGRLDYKALNQAFTSIEDLEGRARYSPAFADVRRESFVATITGLLEGAVQGANQTTGQGTLWKTYVYEWYEVDISYGYEGANSGVGIFDLQGARAIDYADEISTSHRFPAIDFAPYQRFAAGDVVQLTRMAVKSGSTYSMMYSITPLNSISPFLARLTSLVSEGIYQWTGLSRIIEGTTALKTVATNLYEKNRICNPTFTTAMSVNGASWDGSNNWGHGQTLTGGSSTLTKVQLPTGAAGTGTIVMMHELHHPTTGGAAFCFYAVAPVTAACS